MVLSLRSTLLRPLVPLALLTATLLLMMLATGCDESFDDTTADAIRLGPDATDAASALGDDASTSAAAESLGCWSSGQCPTVTCPCSTGEVLYRGCRDGICAGQDACFGDALSACKEAAPEGASVEPDGATTGATCHTNSECASQVCIARTEGASEGYCSQPCHNFTDCPTGWACAKLLDSDETWCVQPPPADTH